MDATGHATEHRRGDHVDGRQVSGVDDLRSKLAQQTRYPAVDAQVFAVALAQRENLYVIAANAVAKAGFRPQADDGMAVAVYRRPVDDVDQAVLHTANGQLVDDVDDKGNVAPVPVRVAGVIYGRVGRHAGASVR